MPDVQTNSEEYAYAGMGGGITDLTPGDNAVGVQSLGSVVENGAQTMDPEPYVTRQTTEATHQDLNPWDATTPQSGQAMSPTQAASLAPGDTDNAVAEADARDVGGYDVDHSAQIPNTPVITSAVAGAAGHATVNWAESPDLDGYALSGFHVTATSSDGGAAGAATVAGNVFTANVAGLTTGKTYTFTVHATNQAGSSPESAASGAVVIA